MPGERRGRHPPRMLNEAVAIGGLAHGSVAAAPPHSPRSSWSSPRSLVRLLDVDPDLAADLGGDARQAALHEVVAPTYVIEAGEWRPTPGASSQRLRGVLGLLVLDGLLVRSVRLGAVEGSELVGMGDVLRPWDDSDQAAALAHESAWRVLQRTRVAVLDARVAAAIGRWPALGAALLERTVQRSRWLGLQLAMTQVRRADLRLRMLFWHLADRWGRTSREGVLLSLPLTHRIIAQLVCMRRPTVSTTLQALERSGEIVRRSGSSWLLTGEGPNLAPVRAGDPSGQEACPA
jgi:CRP/FNR family cyclic AMP-dependent transcriptional regulator